MKKFLLLSLFMLASLTSATAQQRVTKTSHKKAVTTDVVTTGTLTIRKPDYICISTDSDRDQLIMEDTRFTMTAAGKQHVTDSRKNPQFATFHTVLKAVINGQPIPEGGDLTVVSKGGKTTATITPESKKRQLFTSFVLTVDDRTHALCSLRMNGRGEDYTEYTFQ